MTRVGLSIALLVLLVGPAVAVPKALPQSQVYKPLSNSRVSNLSVADCVGLGGEVDVSAAALKACGGAQCVRSNPDGIIYRMCIKER
ncbi:MAG: hypothetical protein ABI216_08780 [Devosia sp.]